MKRANKKKRKMSKWITFTINNKPVTRISKYGAYPSEILPTRELTAYEHGVPVEKVKAHWNFPDTPKIVQKTSRKLLGKRR